MYLSRIKLDIQKRNVMIALSTPSMFHGALEKCAEGDRPHCLWRIDSMGGQMYLLILSEEAIDFSSAAEQFGEEGCEAETLPYEKLLDRVKNGSEWQFRLCANPTYRASKKPGEQRGRICAHSTREHQRAWLMEQSLKHGFTLEESGFDVTQTKWMRFGKGRNRVELLAVTYDGVLTVQDEQLFTEMLCKGIGRGKAYGMGLMTIMSRRS